VLLDKLDPHTLAGEGVDDDGIARESEANPVFALSSDAGIHAAGVQNATRIEAFLDA
jgi:hypothetical protein